MIIAVATDKRDGGQHLIRDAEQRPQDVDAAVRIDDADIEEVAPARDDQALAITTDGYHEVRPSGCHM